MYQQLHDDGIYILDFDGQILDVAGGNDNHPKK
jgi:hypothetical protein